MYFTNINKNRTEQKEDNNQAANNGYLAEEKIY